MKKIISSLKPYLRWVILGGTVFFLVKTFKDNWQEVATIRITSAGWTNLAIAWLLTLLAHVWSGWVWSWILREFNQPFNGAWGVRVYLVTNFAKYLPGNIWHLYGRVRAVQNAGGSGKAATLSVLLESLLMAASALLIALICIQFFGIGLPHQYRWVQFLGLPVVLMAVHPWSLNKAIALIGRLKLKSQDSTPANNTALKMEHYPLKLLLGELGFVGLRSAGFLFSWIALSPVDFHQTILILGDFSLAWMLGLITPGAPGGIGVFEVTAIALLNRYFSDGLILSVVAFNRLVSILAEAAGAALALLSERWYGKTID
jgi:glycosyltransferase 2 family protein